LVSNYPRYLKLFYKLNNRRKWILLKAMIYSLWAEIFVKFNMLYLLKKSIKNKEETQLRSNAQLSIVRDVRKTMQIISRRAPWNPMCLNLSHVTKKILREYQIESTFHLGYLQGRPKEKMEGHAWVTIDDKLVTGWLPNLNDYVEMVHPENKRFRGAFFLSAATLLKVPQSEEL